MLACTVALLLALDVSGSMTDEEYKLEVEGFADAIESQDMAEALKYPLAFRVDQWADAKVTAIDWTLVRNKMELHAFAEQMRTMYRSDAVGKNTMMGRMLDGDQHAWDDLPCTAQRKVMDISGDGKDTPALRTGHVHVDAETMNFFGAPMVPFFVSKYEENGITINGLPILNLAPNNELDWDVIEWYQQNVPTPDGFVIQADGFEDVERAIRRKLIAEIS